MQQRETFAQGLHFVPREMGLSCAALYERVSEYFPCQNWLWPVTQDDLEEPILQAPVQSLSDCCVPPRTVPYEVALPDSKQFSWHGRQLQKAGDVVLVQTNADKAQGCCIALV